MEGYCSYAQPLYGRDRIVLGQEVYSGIFQIKKNNSEVNQVSNSYSPLYCSDIKYFTEINTIKTIKNIKITEFFEGYLLCSINCDVLSDKGDLIHKEDGEIILQKMGTGHSYERVLSRFIEIKGVCYVKCISSRTIDNKEEIFDCYFPYDVVYRDDKGDFVIFTEDNNSFYRFYYGTLISSCLSNKKHRLHDDIYYVEEGKIKVRGFTAMEHLWDFFKLMFGQGK